MGGAGVEPAGVVAALLRPGAALLFWLGLFGLLRLGLSGTVRHLRRAPRPRPRTTGPAAHGVRRLTALEAAQTAQVLRLGFVSGGRSVDGALRYVADLAGAPAPARAACRLALSRLRAGVSPERALEIPALGPEGARLFRLLGALWEAGPEAVEAALGTYAAQARARAEAAGEVKGALLPLTIIRWVLRGGLMGAFLAGLLVEDLRSGWLALGPGIVLYPLLGGMGLLFDLGLSRFLRAAQEGLR